MTDTNETAFMTASPRHDGDRRKDGRAGKVRPQMGVRRRSDRKRKTKHRLSPLTRKILAVNIIALIIPIAGMLYLGPYRDRLIEQEVEALRNQGEIFSGALGEGAISLLEDGQEVLNIVPARHIVRRLAEVSGVHARLFLSDGALAVDNRQLGGSDGTVQVEELPDPSVESDDKIVDGINGLFDDMTDLMDEQEYELYQDRREATVEDYPEAVQALRGEIATRVRKDEDGDLILSVALPVQRYYQVFGSLLLSKTGDKIEAAMASVRLTIGTIFLGALVITVAMSFYLAGTIARPIRRLAAAAETVRHSVGKVDNIIPDFTSRRDEIGDLSGVLRDMTEALQARITAIERFAADVAHEIKNPLTSLRSAVETVSRVQDPEQQKALLRIVQEDVERLDRLISDISDASRLDAELSRSEVGSVDIAGMLDALASMYRTAQPDKQGRADEEGLTYTVERLDNGPFVAEGVESRLVQVFRNLITNAAGFSPDGGAIRLTVRHTDDGFIETTCEDDGPGIPPSKLHAIFDRFYTERPEGEKFGTHSGLGLSISRQIVEAHEGTLRAENRTDEAGSLKGARFIVRIPAS